MLSTAWTAPARVAGRDGFDMPLRVAVPGGDDAQRLRQQPSCTTPITQNHGTTLGSHSSRRPLS